MAEQTLANHSDRLNAINIYPVADADTGTNLYMTVRAAAQALADLEPSDVGVTMAAAGRAAMEQAGGTRAHSSPSHSPPWPNRSPGRSA